LLLYCCPRERANYTYQIQQYCCCFFFFLDKVIPRYDVCSKPYWMCQQMNSQSKAETAQRRKIAGVSLLESLWHANTGTGTAVTADQFPMVVSSIAERSLVTRGRGKISSMLLREGVRVLPACAYT
ncbi:unnamed protein product, partial [Pylaiella littoralis]